MMKFEFDQLDKINLSTLFLFLPRMWLMIFYRPKLTT